MKEAYVFGTEKFELIRDQRVPYHTIYPPPKDQPYKLSHHAVKVFNEKTGRWEIHPCNEAITECPVCGSPIKAYYIPGTTWIACCSEECERKFIEKAKELKSINKAIDYFTNQRKEAERS